MEAYQKVENKYTIIPYYGVTISHVYHVYNVWLISPNALVLSLNIGQKWQLKER